jgi:hypothetical protein
MILIEKRICTVTLRHFQLDFTRRTICSNTFQTRTEEEKNLFDRRLFRSQELSCVANLYTQPVILSSLAPQSTNVACLAA